MARVLFTLVVTSKRRMLRARQMLFQVTGEMPRYGSGFSNWAILLLEQLFPSRELVLAGEPEPSAFGPFMFRLASTPPACLGPDRSGTPAPAAGDDTCLPRPSIMFRKTVVVSFAEGQLGGMRLREIKVEPGNPGLHFLPPDPNSEHPSVKTPALPESEGRLFSLMANIFPSYGPYPEIAGRQPRRNRYSCIACSLRTRHSHCRGIHVRRPLLAPPFQSRRSVSDRTRQRSAETPPISKRSCVAAEQGTGDPSQWFSLENVQFARRCREEGIIAGPDPEVMGTTGRQSPLERSGTSRGVPVIEDNKERLEDISMALKEARRTAIRSSSRPVPAAADAECGSSGRRRNWKSLH